MSFNLMISDMYKLFLYYLLAINFIALFTYGLDKFFAIKHKWRIREATLLGLAAVGGSIGAICGMYLFRHKTKKLAFFIGVPFILILQILLLYFLKTKAPDFMTFFVTM